MVYMAAACGDDWVGILIPPNSCALVS